MIFHIVVLDPVFRKNEVSFQSAYLLALMEGRFRKLVGTSIALLLASGVGKRTCCWGRPTRSFTPQRPVRPPEGRADSCDARHLRVCPKTKSCSRYRVSATSPPKGSLRGKWTGRSGSVQGDPPKVALGLGVAALVAAVLLRG